MQTGLLLGLPAFLSGIYEPILGVLADTGRRRLLLIAGGVLFAASLLLTGLSPGFWLLLVSFVTFYPASGAFVSVSQAELMDREPKRREQNMARWTFAGSVGGAVGPIALLASARLGIGWRGLFLAIGALSVLIFLLAARHAFPPRRVDSRRTADEIPPSFREAIRVVRGALRRVEVLRWLALLEIANLMLDVLFGFLALYFVEVVGVTAEQAALGVLTWTVSQIVGDLLLIPLLERVKGMSYLRVSAGVVAVIFPLFLVVGPFAAKLALVGTIGLLRAGWYALLQARLYSTMPGQSGIAVALGSLAGLAGGLIPLCLGALAEVEGLRTAMWALMAAPLALLFWLPRERCRD